MNPSNNETSRPSGPPLRFFIADLHLDGADTPRALNFRKLLELLSGWAKRRPVELYILGDLFEFWYEFRSALFRIYKADLEALEQATKAGVQLYLFYGNRDFAYGRYVNRRFGATVLGDGEKIELSDTRGLWMEHGDLLCTGDTRYLLFRKFIRSWPVRVAFFFMPWFIARNTIARIRSRTVADKNSKPAKSLEIDLEYARERLEEHECRVLMCGHTHCAQASDLGAGHRLIVLTPWCDEPAGMLDDGRALHPFTLDELPIPPND